MAAEGFLTIGVRVPSVPAQRGRWAEGRTVVEEQKPLPCSAILAHQELLIKRGGVLRRLLALERLEQLEEVRRSPHGHRLTLHRVVQLLLSSAQLGRVGAPTE